MNPSDRPPATRLAPSPTGALHLGNARTFLATWLVARQRGWRIVLRIEDIDGPRIQPGAAVGVLEDLQWLGLDWDGEPIVQSTRASAYASAVNSLLARGLAYPCICTRREAQLAASAPHAEDGSAVYPGTCRDRFATIEEAMRCTGRPPAIRFRVPEDAIIEFHDEFAGTQRFDGARQLGDFVIAKADGTPAYQLAVVVDDSAMSITDVVRGDDLIDSTPRQILLYRALNVADGLTRYTHLPLVIGQDGRRLAKRHGDTRLATYRAAGVNASRILQLLSRWLGMTGAETLNEMIDAFDLAKVPRAPIVFGPDDDAWLRGG